MQWSSYYGGRIRVRALKQPGPPPCRTEYCAAETSDSQSPPLSPRPFRGGRGEFDPLHDDYAASNRISDQSLESMDLVILRNDPMGIQSGTEDGEKGTEELDIFGLKKENRKKKKD